ncbi:hypothetical protein ASD79_03355 [Caulobacter sp. Root655]|uniref:DUF4345 family protein n=1 Tax=Caulobacter sp. Root655 TaxID=1736578 RepID=UPI0006F2EE26|nr:DUF4345 family protein [Caulobacter sp. Root655]KRA66599.1 hypothetical protein ASD79_03355 [Caulobacter sp. Root655]
MSSYGLSLVLAVVACVIGGVLGGMALARPGSASGLAGGDASPNLPDAGALAQSRAFGGLLILSHATAALFLGYQSSVGAAMAFALAMAWLGAALGRTASLLIDKASGRLNLGSLAFEVLIAVTLSLPFFNAGRLVVVRGAGMLV